MQQYPPHISRSVFHCNPVQFPLWKRMFIHPLKLNVTQLSDWLRCSSGSWIRMCRQTCYSYFFSGWRIFVLCSARLDCLSDMISTLLSLSISTGNGGQYCDACSCMTLKLLSTAGVIELALSDGFSCARTKCFKKCLLLILVTTLIGEIWQTQTKIQTHETWPRNKRECHKEISGGVGV